MRQPQQAARAKELTSEGSGDAGLPAGAGRMRLCGRWQDAVSRRADVPSRSASRYVLNPSSASNLFEIK